MTDTPTFRQNRNLQVTTSNCCVQFNNSFLIAVIMLAVVFFNGNSDAFKNIDHQWMVGSSNSNSFISTVQKKWFDLLWRKSTWIPSVGKNILLDALKQNQDIACCTDRLLVSALPGSKITTHQGQKLYSCSSATYKTSLTHRMATRKLPEWQRICAVWFAFGFASPGALSSTW